MSTIFRKFTVMNAPCFNADGGTGGGEGISETVATDSTDTSSVDNTSGSSQTNSFENIFRFEDLPKDQNPILKSLAGQADNITESQKTDVKQDIVPEIKSDEKVSDLSMVLDEIKKINPKAAEKYTSPDSIAKTVINQEKTLTGLFQEKSNLQQLVMNLNSELESLKAQQQQTQEKQEEKQPTPEELEELTEKELEFFNENPLEYKKKIIEQARAEIESNLTEKFQKEFGTVKEQFQAEQGLKQATQIIENFKTAVDDNGNLLHPDFDSVINEMADVLNQFPQLKQDVSKLPDALSLAYKAVKGTSTPAQKVDPAELVKNEEFLKSHIYNNEEIKKNFINDYVKQVKDGQPPIVMSGNQGGTSIITPEEKPKTIQDATRAARKHFGW